MDASAFELILRHWNRVHGSGSSAGRRTIHPLKIALVFCITCALCRISYENFRAATRTVFCAPRAWDEILSTYCAWFRFVRLDEIEKEIATLIDKIVSASEATMEYINKRVDALDKEKKELREKVSQMSAEMYDRKNIGTINGYMNNWESVSMDDKLSVVDALIESIHVGHGKVQISWKI